MTRPTIQDISEAEKALDLVDEILAAQQLAVGITAQKRKELMDHIHALRSARRDSTPREHYASLAAESAEVGR